MSLAIRRDRPRPSRAAGAFALVLALVGSLAGCGEVVTSGSGSAAPVGGSGTDPLSQNPPPDGCPDVGPAVPLPQGAAPAAAVDCVVETERVPGDGEWRVVVTRRAADVTALVEALRLPTLPRTAQVCTTELPLPTYVALEVDGAALTVAPPLDECAKTRSEVRAAWRALVWDDVSRERTARLRTEAAVVAGCDHWKDEIALVTDAQPAGFDAPPPLPTGEATVQICLDETHTPGDLLPTGGRTVAGPAATGLLAELAALPAAASCSTEHTKVAVLLAGTEYAYVELDGCLRVMDSHYLLRQATPELVAELSAG